MPIINLGRVVGDSAYEIAVRYGYTGTESDWIDSLPGVDGINGVNGKSAYEVAVDNGFVGTEADWLDSLIGGFNWANLADITALFGGGVPYQYTLIKELKTQLNRERAKNMATTKPPNKSTTGVTGGWTREQLQAQRRNGRNN